MKNNIYSFTDINLVSVKPCILFGVCEAMYIVFHSNFVAMLHAWSLSHVSFLDLFGLIIGVTNLIINHFSSELGPGGGALVFQAGYHIFSRYENSP